MKRLTILLSVSLLWLVVLGRTSETLDGLTRSASAFSQDAPDAPNEDWNEQEQDGLLKSQYSVGKGTIEPDYRLYTVVGDSGEDVRYYFLGASPSLVEQSLYDGKFEDVETQIREKLNRALLDENGLVFRGGFERRGCALFLAAALELQGKRGESVEIYGVLFGAESREYRWAKIRRDYAKNGAASVFQEICRLVEELYYSGGSADDRIVQCERDPKTRALRYHCGLVTLPALEYVTDRSQGGDEIADIRRQAYLLFLQEMETCYQQEIKRDANAESQYKDVMELLRAIRAKYY